MFFDAIKATPESLSPRNWFFGKIDFLWNQGWHLFGARKKTDPYVSNIVVLHLFYFISMIIWIYVCYQTAYFFSGISSVTRTNRNVEKLIYWTLTVSGKVLSKCPSIFHFIFSPIHPPKKRHTVPISASLEFQTFLNIP